MINEYGTLFLYGALSCFQAMAFMMAGVLKQLSFYGVSRSGSHSTPNLEGHGISFCPASHLKTVQHGWPYLHSFQVHG